MTSRLALLLAGSSLTLLGLAAYLTKRAMDEIPYKFGAAG